MRSNHNPANGHLTVDLGLFCPTFKTTPLRDAYLRSASNMILKELLDIRAERAPIFLR